MSEDGIGVDADFLEGWGHDIKLLNNSFQTVVQLVSLGDSAMSCSNKGEAGFAIAQEKWGKL